VQYDPLPEDLGPINVDAIQTLVRNISSVGLDSMTLYIDSEENLSRLLAEEATEGKVRRTCSQFGVGVAVAYCNFLHKTVLGPLDASARQGLWTKIGRLSGLLGLEVIEMTSPMLPYGADETGQTDRKRAEVVGFNPSWWEGLWGRYTDAMTESCAFAREFGLKLAVEPMPRAIISGTDSLLRLFDFVDSDNLGAVADIGRFQTVKEIPVVSIMKLGRKISSVHLSDNDGITEWHWAPGHGKIDWSFVLGALTAVGYDGTLALDVSGIDVANELREGRDYITKLLSASGPGKP
jgi:sugar phosphate isomerase/epimerase